MGFPVQCAVAGIDIPAATFALFFLILTFTRPPDMDGLGCVVVDSGRSGVLGDSFALGFVPDLRTVLEEESSLK